MGPTHDFERSVVIYGYKKLGTTTKTNYIDKSAAKGKTYYYKVAIGYKDSTGVQLSGIMSSPVSVKVVK